MEIPKYIKHTDLKKSTPYYVTIADYVTNGVNIHKILGVTICKDGKILSMFEDREKGIQSSRDFNFFKNKEDAEYYIEYHKYRRSKGNYPTVYGQFVD